VLPCSSSIQRLLRPSWVCAWPLLAQAAGRSDDAIRMHEATIKQQESKLGPDHPRTLISRNNPADAYTAAGQYTRAEPLRRGGLERARERFGLSDPRIAAAMAQLGSNLIQERKWTVAERILRERLAIREQAQPDDWNTFSTRSQLGGSLLGQKKFADTESLILAGYEGIKAREAKIPAPGKGRLAEAAERIVKLYASWGKADTAREWQLRLGLVELPADVFAQ
jgi:hypothetical protein